MTSAGFASFNIKETQNKLYITRFQDAKPSRQFKHFTKKKKNTNQNGFAVFSPAATTENLIINTLDVHSPGYAYGENIFWGQGQRWSATNVVASWVAEKQWYHHNTNTCSGPDCSHYTQIIWRTTEKLESAKIKCDTGDTFVTCEYYPPGNSSELGPII